MSQKYASLLVGAILIAILATVGLMAYFSQQNKEPQSVCGGTLTKAEFSDGLLKTEALRTIFADGDIWMGGRELSIYHLSDGWLEKCELDFPIREGSPGSVNQICIWRDTIVAAADGAGLITIKDGDISQITPPDDRVYTCTQNADNLLVATYRGIYEYDGSSWELFLPDMLPKIPYHAISVGPGHLAIGTINEGIILILEGQPSMWIKGDEIHTWNIELATWQEPQVLYESWINEQKVVWPKKVRDVATWQDGEDFRIAFAYDSPESSGGIIEQRYSALRLYNTARYLNLTGITYLPDGRLAIADYRLGAAVQEELSWKKITDVPAFDLTTIGGSLYVTTENGLMAFPLD